jgi:uncharacterized membrane protein (UPF0136 family)
LRRRPGIDLFSLISGLAFAAVAILYLLGSAGVLHVPGRLVIPLILITLGAAGLISAIHQRTRRKDRRVP